MTAEDEVDYVSNQLECVTNFFTLAERVTLAFIVLIGGYADIRTLLLLVVTYGLARRAFAFFGTMAWDPEKQTAPPAIRRFLLHTLDGWMPLPTDAFFCYYLGYAAVARKSVPSVLRRLANEEKKEQHTMTPHS